MRVLFGLLMLAAATPACAQVRDVVSVPQGLQLVLHFTEPFSAASVGDPRIVDAIPRSDRIIIVQGKEPGITDIVTIADGKVVRQIAVTVTPPSAAGKVLTHNKKNLSEYTAYSCTGTSCARTKDDYEGKDIILFGPGGTAIGVSTSGSAASSGVLQQIAPSR